MDKAREKEDKWKGPLLVAALGVIAWLLWSYLPNVFWTVVNICWNMIIPVCGYMFLMRTLGDDKEAERAPGPLSFIPDIKMRYFLIMILLPGLGFFHWNLQKRSYAAMGPAVNATISAGVNSREIIKTAASFVLLPLVSMVSASHNAGDHVRTMQIVGTGLGLSLASGIVGQLGIFMFVKPLMSIFEGAQPLLSNATFLMKLYCLAFPLIVLNETMMGVLAGMNEYRLVGECLMIVVVFALCNSTLFFMGMIDIPSTLFLVSMTELLVFVMLSWNLWARLERLRRERLPEAPAVPAGDAKDKALLEPAAGEGREPEGSFRAVLRDLEPSREVLREMVLASRTSITRNLALRLRGFLSGMVATRLGNVQGSAFTIQQTLTAYMSGPAGVSGLFTANVAPLLLSNEAFGIFILSTKATLGMLLVIASLWFYVAAWGGPARLLWFGGVVMDSAGSATEAVSALSATCNATAGALCNSTADLVAAAAAGNQTGGVQSMGEFEDYLRVLTPLNHWLWAAGSVANELAAPFDGFLTVLGCYDYMGKVYAGDFLLVLLPALFVANRAAENGQCSLPGPLASLSGCNSFTGVMVAGLLWGAVRLAAMLWAVFAHEVPRLQRQQDAKEAACSKEVVLDYLRARCKVPPEEVAAQKEERKKSFIHRFQPHSPMGRWAAEHGTSTEVMTSRLKKLHERGDEDFKTAMKPFWDTYGDWM